MNELAVGARDRLRKHHGAAEGHGDRRVREDLPQQVERVGIDVRAAEQQVADLVVHQIHHAVVAGDGLEQWRGGVQIRNILRLQNEHGLLDDVVDVGGHFRGRVASGDLLHPAGVDVDRVEDRAQPLGDQAGEVADTVRAARHQAEETLARHKAAGGEVLRLPLDNLRNPIRQLRGPFRSPGGAAGFEYLGHRRRATRSRGE